MFSIKNKKILLPILFVVFFSIFSFFIGFSVHAAQSVDLGVDQVGASTGLPSDDVRVVIAKIIRVALGFLGTAALVIIIYAGYLWMTAGGNEEKISQARKIILNAVIGLAIILSSYAFTSFIITRLLGATNGGNLPEHCYNGTKDEDETGTDCGGTCGACSSGGDTSFPGSSIFYVDSLPGAGDVCIQNVHLEIIFNKNVDLTTMLGNVVVKKKTGEEVAGKWVNGVGKNSAVFNPEGACGQQSGNDCLEPNTAYTLEFKNSSAIKTADGLLTLNCTVKAGCGPVDFTSGSGVDRTPPTIKFISPADKSSYPVGSTVPIKLEFSDDKGVQNVSLYQNNNLISSKSLSGCQKNGTFDVSWSAVGMDPGTYGLNAFVHDWAVQKNQAAISLKLLPFHCYNDALEKDLGEISAGPPACGGECGKCGGDVCQSGTDCASGYCDLSGGTKGVCVDKMRIDGVSPLSGGVSSYVSVAGYYFGDTPGDVYFAKVKNPNVDNQADWVKAGFVTCANGAKSWTSNQILVEAPAGAVDGPIKVVTGNVVGKDNVSRQFTDVTNDAWGAKINDFKFTSEVRPGVCSIAPSSGVAGDQVQIFGKNFGLLDSANDYVLFGDKLKGETNTNKWTDSSVQAKVPYLEQGFFAVKIFNNGLESNGVRFTINSGESLDTPLILSVSPEKAAADEYITITGKNFGTNVGAVWFKSSSDSEAILGDFSFPEACQKSVWRDDQIIVKFPKNKGEVGKKYYVQIRTSDNKISRFDSKLQFLLSDGDPKPGICKITPVSGPIPFAEGQNMTISGEHFGQNAQVFFWKTGGNPVTTEGRAKASVDDIVSTSDNTLIVHPPAETISGPLVVVNSVSNKISNPAQFTVFDCVKNNNTCNVANYTCCNSGQDKGVCRPPNELCEGKTLSSGYIWRFSTGDIPLIPQVVERCDSDTDIGKNLPTPSPSILWDVRGTADQHNVCRSALVTVEFTVALDQTSVNPSSVIVNKCSNTDTNNCLNPVAQKLTVGSLQVKVAQGVKGNESRSYLSILPDAGKWDDDSWYQVVLTKAVKSSNKAALGLAPDKPCTNNPDSAYCFVFRTGAKDCRMKSVVITPYSYWTSILEEPMKLRINGVAEQNLEYIGGGLSDQRCIMMDTSNFDWNWNSSNKNYAAIYGEASKQSVNASALTNTVGIGLSNPADAVNINATASLSGKSLSGSSPLTIDLSDPEVVDYWPKCLEACTNAEVGVQFNTALSLKNLPGAINGGAVQLLKCNDENCLGTTSVIALKDVVLDSARNYTIIKIANSTEGSAGLEPNTLYKVVISSTSTDPLSATNQIWSAGTFRNPASWSKPYNKVFTWRFRTKKDKCSIDRVEVVPPLYSASSIKEKTIYNSESYSSPDACSATGQKLDPWSVNWEWTSSDSKVATVSTFTTLGKNNYCTNSCTRKGSDIPAGKTVTPVCGNGKVEAGEDCDSPDKEKGCSLNCLFTGNKAASCGNGVVEPDLGEACDPKDPKTSTGCSADCRHLGSNQTTGSNEVGASICGNGLIGSGESCDLGISSDGANSLSALNCSQKCTHTGTFMSTKWCYDNRLARGGFASNDYETACQLSYSQCGDKVQNPDEDPGCDDPNTGWNSAACNEFCLKNSDTECVANSEGCDELGRHKGSSLLYSNPSVCGDGKSGMGEDGFCETALIVKHSGLVDPWSLVSGVGKGVPSGQPPTQSTIIKALTREQTKGGPVSGQGKFEIACGFKSDDECKDVFGSDYGVGENTCCYAKTKLLSTYPAANTSNACPNTYLEASFDSLIDSESLKNNILIAHGADKCLDSEQEVTDLVAKLDELKINVHWYSRFFASVKNIFSKMWGDSASAAPTKWCVGNDVGIPEVIAASDAATSTSKISIQLTKPLQLDSDYAIILKDGVRSFDGVSIGKNNGKEISWKFSTISTICQINSVTVEPSKWSFSRPGVTTTLMAKAATNNGAFIQGIPGFYDWEYSWGPRGNGIVSFDTTTSSLKTITSENRNGEVDIGASAFITKNTYTSDIGLVGTGRSHIIGFLCQNPWPPKDLYLDNKGPYTIFPFEDASFNNDGFDVASNSFNNTAIPPSAAVADGYFNFSTYYCADSGGPSASDDLPYLRGAVQVSTNLVTPSSSLKRFIFTNIKNSDAIGVQVFPNPRHLTVDEWYSADKASGGQGFFGQLTHLKVAGYDAVSDGNNIYVDALNYSQNTKNVYSNIYLFSINDNATAETKKVFEDLIKNLKLNINLSNFGYCGSTPETPNFVTVCQNDLDCSNGQVCSQTVDKLRRNYERLRDLKSLQTGIENYIKNNNGKAPELNEGTYLKGQTISVWPSWSELGNTIGVDVASLVDPINKLGTAGTCSKSTNKFCTENGQCPNGENCVLHDPSTGWSTDDRRFSFACATSSYAYRYLFLPSATSSYAVKARFEQPGIVLNNQADFYDDFINPSHFVVNSATGICNQDQEISTLNQGVCGDRQVNTIRGEECDPPGRVRYGACTNDKVSVDVCTNNCKWTPSSTPEVACSYLSKCGNGTVETGEQCDDGKLNGRYNHCSKTCTWPPNDPPGYCGDGQVQTGSEVCDIKAKLNNKDGVCIYGLSIGLPCDRDFDCKQPGLGVTSYVAGSCALVENTKVRYGTEKADSCNWDCQSFGPYCGDGVVQPEFGEQCDGSQSCSVSSINGTKYCGADCRWSDKSPVGWWRLDDAVVSTQPPRIGIPFAAKKLSFPDAMNKTPGTCSDVACPGFEKQGKILGSFNFNGNNAITIPHTEDLMPYTALSVEAWIKPSTPLSNWSRVLEKGGYTFGGGYGFQFDPSFKQGFVVWGSDTQKPSLEVYSKNALKENEWTHLVGVYNRQGSNHSLKLYINGALDNTATVVSSTAIMGHSTRDLIIGQASGGQDSFKGLIDEIKIYNRVLSLAEISERYNTGWPCSVSTTVSIAVAGAPICGDGKVDAGEACDRGADNGLSCTPNYGGKCTYCSNDCRNVIDVQSQQYCGDGIVNAPVESCDTDPNTKLIYSSSPNFGTQAVKNIDHQGFQVISCSDESQETATFKKGNKICANRCSVVQSNCTVCGETAEDDKNGVSIRGGVVNVINPLSADPISVFTERDDSGKAAFDLTLSDEFDNKVVGKAYWLGDSSPSYYLKTADSSGFSPTRPVKVNSDPRCSFADQPNYKMFINSDNSHGFDFPITLNAPIWQYDLILSPVIDQTKRPSDVRIVASWVNQADFNSQFIVPSIGIPKLATTSTGDDYYFKPSVNGIWKHGFGDSGYKTKLRSFTVDAAQMIDDEYMFFVQLPQAKPTDPGIYQYKDVAHLKVDVYLPENDSNVSHFARPSFTFYLTNAIRSDNSSAPYWHVFNIQKNASGLDRILPVNKIMTRF